MIPHRIFLDPAPEGSTIVEAWTGWAVSLILFYVKLGGGETDNLSLYILPWVKEKETEKVAANSLPREVLVVRGNTLNRRYDIQYYTTMDNSAPGYGYGYGYSLSYIPPLRFQTLMGKRRKSTVFRRPS